ncbi:MAG: hypothetical protein K9L28_01405, partial [Synergistales bacterium]|nr:hypothetical protein [Synergistales bacterium]
MTIFTGRTVSLWSTGMAVPERVMDNHELETLVDTNDKWIRERTGIIERRIAAPDENTSDLAAAAGAEALERAGLDIAGARFDGADSVLDPAGYRRKDGVRGVGGHQHHVELLRGQTGPLQGLRSGGGRQVAG